MWGGEVGGELLSREYCPGGGRGGGGVSAGDPTTSTLTPPREAQKGRLPLPTYPGWVERRHPLPASLRPSLCQPHPG